jgi:hypothetical protein
MATAPKTDDDPTDIAGVQWDVPFEPDLPTAAAAKPDAAVDLAAVDFSQLSFGDSDGAPGEAADIFGSVSFGEDPFAASSPMAKFNFDDGGGLDGAASADIFGNLDVQTPTFTFEEDAGGGGGAASTAGASAAAETTTGKVGDVGSGGDEDEDDKRHFDPNGDPHAERWVPPGEAVPSGHEHERELFSATAQMHRFFKEHEYGGVVRSNIWFDCGKGQCAVYASSGVAEDGGEGGGGGGGGGGGSGGDAGGALRLVFRQVLTGKVTANFRLAGALAQVAKDNAKRVIFSNAQSLLMANANLATDDPGASDTTDTTVATATAGDGWRVDVQNVAFRFADSETAAKLLALSTQMQVAANQ